MFKRHIESETRRVTALGNTRTGLQRAQDALARANRASAKVGALQAKVTRLEECVSEIECAAAPLSERMLQAGAFLYLCGLRQGRPDDQYAKTCGFDFRRTQFLNDALADALALGWGTLSESGRFQWTPEGEEELTALWEMYQRPRE